MAGTNATAARNRRAAHGDGARPAVAHAICGLADRPAAWRSGVSAISGKSVALQVGVRSAVTFPLIVLSLCHSTAHRIAAWLRGRYHQKQKMAWTAPCDRHYRRCRSRIMERPAADSAVLARLGIAGTVPRRASRTTVGRAQGVHWRRWCSPHWPPALPQGRNHALYACRIRRCRAIPGREHGHGLRHDAQTGIAARWIAAVAAAAGIGYRTDLRPDDNRRDGGREPVRPCRGLARCSSPMWATGI